MMQTLGPVRRAGIFANMAKPDAVRVVRDTVRWLLAHQVSVVAADNLAAALAETGVRTLPSPAMGPECDVVISIGGDGTLIHAARSVSDSGTPVLGVNLGGKLGFLTELEAAGIPGALGALLAGDVPVEERMNLQVVLRRRDGKVSQLTALNDCAVNRGEVTGILEFTVHVGREYLGTFLADGVIVATSTGSTAYSLSAGGPILHPGMSAFVVTPICPHALSLRPLVLGADHEIEVRMVTPDGIARVSVDGSEGEDLVAGDGIVISRSSRVTRLVRLSSRSFYTLLREKFEWGGWRSGDAEKRHAR